MKKIVKQSFNTVDTYNNIEDQSYQRDDSIQH